MIFRNIASFICVGVFLSSPALAGGGPWPEPTPTPRPDAPSQLSIHDEGHTEINCKKCNGNCRSQSEKVVLLFKFDQKWLRYLCDKNIDSSIFSVRKYDEGTED